MLKIARSIDGTTLIGSEKGFVPSSSISTSLRSQQEVLAAATNGDLPNPAEANVRRKDESELSFNIPICDIGKIWGIGLNYIDHASDLNEDQPNEPASFMKPETAAVRHGGPVCLPPTEITNHVTGEAELGVVIGKECSQIGVDKVEDVIAGYIPIIDMTAEDILRKNPRYLTRSKSFDNFIVIGPYICVEPGLENFDDIHVKTVHNDKTIASNKVGNMLMRPHELVAFHSKIMTLKPGDIISTGTPGAVQIEPGDVIKAEIKGLGTTQASVTRTSD